MGQFETGLLSRQFLFADCLGDLSFARRLALHRNLELQFRDPLSIAIVVFLSGFRTITIQFGKTLVRAHLGLGDLHLLRSPLNDLTSSLALKDALVSIDLTGTEKLRNRRRSRRAQNLDGTIWPEEVGQIQGCLVDRETSAFKHPRVLLGIEFDHLARKGSVFAQSEDRGFAQRGCTVREVAPEHFEPGRLNELPEAGCGRVRVASRRIATGFDADDLVHEAAEIALQRGRLLAVEQKPGLFADRSRLFLGQPKEGHAEFVGFGKSSIPRFQKGVLDELFPRGQQRRFKLRLHPGNLRLHHGVDVGSVFQCLFSRGCRSFGCGSRSYGRLGRIFLSRVVILNLIDDSLILGFDISKHSAKFAHLATTLGITIEVVAGVTERTFNLSLNFLTALIQTAILLSKSLFGACEGVNRTVDDGRSTFGAVGQKFERSRTEIDDPRILDRGDQFIPCTLEVFQGLLPSGRRLNRICQLVPKNTLSGRQRTSTIPSLFHRPDLGKLVGSQEVQFTVEFADRFSIAAERRCDLDRSIGKISAGNLGKLLSHPSQPDDLLRGKSFAHEGADQIASRCHFNAKATNRNGSLRQFRRAVTGTVSRKSQFSGERAHGGAFTGCTSKGCDDRGKNRCNASKDWDRAGEVDHDVRPDLGELSSLLCENLDRGLTHRQAGNHVIDLIAEVGQLPGFEAPNFNFLSVTILSGIAFPRTTSSTAVRSSHATGCARGAFHSCGMDPFGLSRALRSSFLLVQRRNRSLHGSRDILGSRVRYANRIRIAEPVADI